MNSKFLMCDFENCEYKNVVCKSINVSVGVNKYLCKINISAVYCKYLHKCLVSLGCAT